MHVTSRIERALPPVIWGESASAPGSPATVIWSPAASAFTPSLPINTLNTAFSANTASKIFRFNDLPPELRDNIYVFCLKNIRLPRQHGLGIRFQGGDVVMQRISRQIRQEYLAVVRSMAYMTIVDAPQFWGHTQKVKFQNFPNLKPPPERTCMRINRELVVSHYHCFVPGPDGPKLKLRYPGGAAENMCDWLRSLDLKLALVCTDGLHLHNRLNLSLHGEELDSRCNMGVEVYMHAAWMEKLIGLKNEHPDHPRPQLHNLQHVSIELTLEPLRFVDECEKKLLELEEPFLKLRHVNRVVISRAAYRCSKCAEGGKETWSSHLPGRLVTAIIGQKKPGDELMLAKAKLLLKGQVAHHRRRLFEKIGGHNHPLHNDGSYSTYDYDAPRGSELD